MTDGYERRISAEEAREGYLFVEKAKLSFFPPLGQRFSLSKGDFEGPVAVESYACSCRGPEKPHEHYIIRLNGLVQGQRVRILRLAPDRYGLMALS